MLAAIAAVATQSAEAQQVSFGKYFTGGTLRVDCLREGSAQGDTVWVERWVDRMSDWHGSRKELLDPFDNGDYRVEMRDAKTGKTIYSRGYSNLFREYKDTPEGKRGVKKRFEETHLLPMPKKAVYIALQKRDEGMRLRDASVVLFDPKSQKLEHNFFVGERVDLEINGDPSKKVDVVIVAQGYENASDPRLRIDYFRMKEILFGKEPFASHRRDFNVYGVCGDVDAEFNTFGIDRYLMTQSLWKLHNRIGTTPCDHIIVMVNSDKYGGGAIYNFYAVSTMHTMAAYVLPHEFGHSFGGLADEYVDEDLSYGSLHVTPYEPPKGVYRPTMHCMMRDYAPFCPVCAKRLEEIFGMYTK